MAGMLPGVECARRRRIHQGGGTELQNNVANGRTRRPSFCLYTSSFDIHLNPSSFLQRNSSNQSFRGEKLQGVVREAKERLDERLRNLEPKRGKGKGSNTKSENGGGVSGSVVLGELQSELVGAKKRGSKKFSWAKFGWKASEQEECAVCLERFEGHQKTVHLLCAHRFHSVCLGPWLERNAHCPCCRMQIQP